MRMAKEVDLRTTHITSRVVEAVHSNGNFFQQHQQRSSGKPLGAKCTGSQHTWIFSPGFHVGVRKFLDMQPCNPATKLELFEESYRIFGLWMSTLSPTLIQPSWVDLHLPRCMIQFSSASNSLERWLTADFLTISTKKKHDFLRNLGVCHCLNPQTDPCWLSTNRPESLQKLCAVKGSTCRFEVSVIHELALD